MKRILAASTAAAHQHQRMLCTAYLACFNSLFCYALLNADKTMQFQTYTPALQAQLLDFFAIMQASRGRTFDRLHLPADLRDIQTSYQNNGGEFWVLLAHTEIIGTIGLRLLDAEQGIAELKRFFVLPSHQRRGVGTQLMAHAMAAATQRGWQIIRLDTMRNAASALSIYQKFGFYDITRYNDNPTAEVFLEKKLFS
ncbi:GNAT family N-acetyltransferase [Chitinibacter fontanus]|uniref:GNAT family N-acetyltransferase n=1 Tax=Chitinibacter fontanus TaxID=1737446 RepID=A0A7D5ZBS7_9NEIS|nr:GNAT family N-acetyltransferase [Chitinibacter fontanus]QLI81405.1 GNAT family N-acetyltransferase [Chitinibacter fontanus]